MNELTHQVAIVVDFFLSRVRLSWNPRGSSLVDLDEHKYWVGVVLAENLIDVNISKLNGWATGVPAHNAFL